MPYVSKAQQRFAHTDTAKREGFPTAEFDAASKGQMGGKPEHTVKRSTRTPSARPMRGKR